MTDLVIQMTTEIEGMTISQKPTGKTETIVIVEGIKDPMGEVCSHSFCD